MRYLAILAIMILVSCGSGEPRIVEAPGGGYNPPSGGGQIPGGNNGKASFREARQVISQYCESCHANSPWLRDEQSLRRSSVLGRTRNNSMPPQNSPIKMPNAARQRLISFF